MRQREIRDRGTTRAQEDSGDTAVDYGTDIFMVGGNGKDWVVVYAFKLKYVGAKGIMQIYRPLHAGLSSC